MSKIRRIATFGAASLAALALFACQEGAPGGGGNGETPYEVADGFTLDDSATFDDIAANGLVVGVKEDQPGLGYLDPTTNEYSGFDVDIARWIAASLGVEEGDIDYQPIPSANREQAIVNGDIHYYVGTYSITDGRKEQIDFAGPYFITGQGLLVGADSDIASEADLSADTTVCSATGSTPIQNIRENYPDVPTREFDTYSQCVEALINDQVDVVTTDEAILIGYAAENPDDMKVVGEPFTVENYGVGLPKGDDALREHVNALFEDNPEIWQAIYDNNLGASGVEGDQPAVDRY